MIGSTIAHYRITAKLGEGGMGVVYRALDTKLDREVAVKVLPAEVAQAPDRLARFEREAKTLASLNHPNIAAIYGVENAALVMELVEGSTLAERLAAGALPVEEAIGIARQIAEALEAAHDKGIVHRDLKPANVKITSDGIVKLLDFGLAKAMETSKQIALDPVNSPTVVNASIPGVIMGTAGYMSPEQAKGQPVDKRADIWAFGVVLFEMLSGRQLFDSGTVAEAIADVLRADIDLKKLPVETPPSVRRLLSRCLDRNPKARLRDIGEARIILSDPGATDPVALTPNAPPLRPVRANYIPWIVATLLAAGIPAAWVLKPKPELPLVQFEISTPEAVTADAGVFGLLALSPDGVSIVYRAVGKDQKQMLWLRRLTETTWKVLPGTENGTRPFWSPDSRTIGFFADGKMKRMAADGGAVQVICEADPAGASWSAKDEIFFQQEGKPFLKVRASGGKPEPAIDGDTAPRDGTELLLLPDGAHFLYDTRTKEPGSHLGSLRDKKVDLLVVPGRPNNATRSSFHTNPAGGGWVIHATDGQLVASTFDPRSMPRPGPPVLLRQGVSRHAWSSSSSSVAYLNTKAAPRQLSWVGRTGTVVETIGRPGNVTSPRIASDQKFVLYSDDRRVVRWDLVVRTASDLTNASVEANDPVPLPNGDKMLLFQSPPRALVERPISGGGAERILYRGGNVTSGLSKDGRWVLVSALRAGKYALILVPYAGGDPVPIFNEAVQPAGAHFSPDGRWIVYSALVQGKREVFVSSLPKEAGGSAENNGTWQISRDGGDQPVWRGDGKEIVYYGANEQMMSVAVASEKNQFRGGAPTALFPVRLRNSRMAGYDITPDGSRFLIPLMQAGQSDEYSIGFIQNWPKLMTRKAEPE